MVILTASCLNDVNDIDGRLNDKRVAGGGMSRSRTTHYPTPPTALLRTNGAAAAGEIRVARGESV